MGEAMIRHFLRAHRLDECFGCPDCKRNIEAGTAFEDQVKAYDKGKAQAREASYARDPSKGDAWAI